MRRTALVAAVLVVVCAGCLTPPVRGPVTLGPTHEPGGYHHWPAVDWRVPVGTPVRSPGNGTVARVAHAPRPGLYVLIVLRRATSEGCRVVALKHLDRVDVEVGQAVGRGQRVAVSGTTSAARPHLHHDCYTRIAHFNDRHQARTWTYCWTDQRGRTRVARPDQLDRGQRLYVRSACR